MMEWNTRVSMNEPTHVMSSKIHEICLHFDRDDLQHTPKYTKIMNGSNGMELN